MLAIRGLHKRRPGAGERSLFDGVALDLAAGELVAIMGESGVGKSTLLNVIAGLEPAEGGSVTLAGTTVTALDDDAAARWRRAHVGFVFQAFHVLPYLTVAQNVALPLKLNRWTRAASAERVVEMLDAVGLADRADSWPRELSGGELQRVAIARALAHRPRLVLADEPTGNLDPETADQVIALLARELARNDAAGIVVTHSLRAAGVATRILVLRSHGLAPLDRGAAA